MHVALVSMPWAFFDLPSMALGSLKALLLRERPEVRVSCHHVQVAMWQQIEAHYERLSADPRAEMLLLPLLFPDRRPQVLALLQQWLEEAGAGADQAEPLLERVLQAGEAICGDLADRLAGRCRLAGFTVTYGQLFSSLAAARVLRARDPEVCIVLGGAGVDLEIGPSVLACFEEVDHVVQGEGELPLLGLVDALASGGDPAGVPGVLGRGVPCGPGTAGGDGGETRGLTGPSRLGWQVPDLDWLPPPDYSEYHELAEELSIYWHIPLETSRGCWWNRALERDDPLRACAFCGLNAGSYREKSPALVAEHLGALCQKHSLTRFRLMDNVLRSRDLPGLLSALQALPMDLRFNAEARAQISPQELLQLWEAGCVSVQVGIEGLSSRYLRRLGKGTLTIHNLQAMKTCFELGLECRSNLLVHFPGATQEEVDETAETVGRFAVAYRPTDLSRFNLCRGSALERRPGHFGLSRLRPDEQLYRPLPEVLRRELEPFWLDYACDPELPRADWTPVEQAVARWRELHERLEPGNIFSRMPLFYTDGGTFLEIVDRREGFRLITLEASWREVYLYCMQVRPLQRVRERFAGLPAEELEAMLEAMLAEGLVFVEAGRVLSLAAAVTPRVAARRIRAQ